MAMQSQFWKLYTRKIPKTLEILKMFEIFEKRHKILEKSMYAKNPEKRELPEKAPKCSKITGNTRNTRESPKILERARKYSKYSKKPKNTRMKTYLKCRPT